MALSPGRITSAGLTAYNQETLVIPLSSKNQPCRRTDGHDDTLQNPHPIAASSSSQPNKTARKQNRAARQLRTCRWSRRPLNLSPFALAQITGGHATKSP
jgi:hypothetical protein